MFLPPMTDVLIAIAALGAIIVTLYLLARYFKIGEHYASDETSDDDYDDDDDFDSDEDWDEEDPDEDEDPFHNPRQAGDEDAYEYPLVFKSAKLDGDWLPTNPNPFDLRLRVPVEIGAPVIGPETFEMTDMSLRLTHPHLYADNWYEICRRELSLWVVEQTQLQVDFRKEMGLAS